MGFVPMKKLFPVLLLSVLLLLISVAESKHGSSLPDPCDSPPTLPLPEAHPPSDVLPRYPLPGIQPTLSPTNPPTLPPPVQPPSLYPIYPPDLVDTPTLPPDNLPIYSPSYSPPIQPPTVPPPVYPPSASPSYPPTLSPQVIPPTLSPHHPHHHAPKHCPVHKSVAVKGVVVCKSCIDVDNDTLAGAYPVVGLFRPFLESGSGSRAVVKLECKITKLPKIEETKTDDNGRFFFLEASKNFTCNSISKCKVFLVSSTYPNCQKKSNLNGGITGATLKHKDGSKNASASASFDVYTTGPLAFQSNC